MSEKSVDTLYMLPLFKDPDSLIDVLAQMCHVAQEHVSNPEAFGSVPDSYMQCTSYQVACYLEHNTVDGYGGVEWDIVYNQLCQRPPWSIALWRRTISALVAEHGGWLLPEKPRKRSR